MKTSHKVVGAVVGIILLTLLINQMTMSSVHPTLITAPTSDQTECDCPLEQSDNCPVCETCPVCKTPEPASAAPALTQVSSYALPTSLLTLDFDAKYPAPGLLTPPVASAAANTQMNAVGFAEGANYAAGATKNLIVGLATALKPKEFARFLLSLREFSPASETDVVIILSDAEWSQPEVRRIFEQAQARAVLFDPDKVPTPWRDYHPSNYRHYLYRLLLNKYWPYFSTTIRRMAILDIRDTAFQADPFGWFPHDGFFAPEEARAKKLQACGWNSKWVRNCFRQEIYKGVQNEFILCSGTVFGGFYPVVRWVKEMQSLLRQRSFCQSNGIDQGLHNVLVRLWPDLLASQVSILRDDNGPVATLQARKGSSVNGQGQTVDKEGRVQAVVHQLDRKHEVTKYFEDKYPVP